MAWYQVLLQVMEEPMPPLVEPVGFGSRDNPATRALVDLTAAISVVRPEAVVHGFLGGEHGYGAHWDDDIFLMRPYCWCEKDDCPWCAGCDCPPEAQIYLIDGRDVSFEEWDSERYAIVAKETGGRIRSSADLGKILDDDALDAALDAAWAVVESRCQTKREPTCPFCLGTVHADKGAVPGHPAPNFWHKPTGLKAWWYKYIGRGMLVSSLTGWPEAVGACIEHVSTSGVPIGRT
jgi:hypothetical protein